MNHPYLLISVRQSALDGTVSHRGRNAGFASLVILLVTILAGFAISVPVTSKAQILSPYTSTSFTSVTILVSNLHTDTITYTTGSAITETTTQEVSTTSQVWNLTPVTLNCSNTNSNVEWTYQREALADGMNVNVSWSASNTVDVYVFNSSQFTNWNSSGIATSHFAGQKNAPSKGSLSFQVLVDDSYYLVLHNPHLGLFCEGSTDLGINSATGIATYQTQTISEITRVHTYVSSGQTVTTQTLTTTIFSPTAVSGTITETTTKSCSQAFWNSLFSPKC